MPSSRLQTSRICTEIAAQTMAIGWAVKRMSAAPRLANRVEKSEMPFGVTPVRASHALRPIAQDDDRLAIGRREASSSSPISISPTR